MKKIYILSLFLSYFVGISQENTSKDALRYAVDDITGTARFRSMSGAFGAVGGDLSSININPAGSAIFSNNIASITASSFNIKNNSNYFGTKTKENYSVLDLNQIGAVLVFTDSNPKNNWKKISVAINYENANNLDNRIFSAGTNPNNSIGNYFLNFAQGIPINVLENYSYSDLDFGGQQAYLGYNAYLFDLESPETYISNVPSGRYYQENQIVSNGYNGKLSGNFATSYKNKLFLGVNLNAHFTDFTKRFSVFENNNNPINDLPRSSIKHIRFDNELYTYGSGFSFNLGAILQATKEFRIGLAYESPTWYNLNDELIQGIESVSINNPDNNSNPKFYPDVLNIYPTYKLKTPEKWTVSGAYVFGNRGLISADISRKDYSNTKYKPTKYYDDLNIDMNQNLTQAIEVRLGGEYRIKQLSLRAGYRFEESPFKVDYAMGDLTGYSGGIGYNFGESKLDLAYSNSHRNYNQSFVSSGMNDTARIRTIQNNVTLTYSINF